jgi:ubiquinone/menaquinone biosynthesis C-methylase UbiE/uncharacterized protein YbaR (Trm112 family)
MESAFIEVLQCPRCRASLTAMPSSLRCSDCAAEFRMADGILQFFTDHESRADSRDQSDESVRYREVFRRAETVSGYRHSFERRRRKRSRTRREVAILRDLLGHAGPSRMILNVPCGWGRLSAPVRERARYLIEADTSAEQVMAAKEHAVHGDTTLWMTASGFALPFRDKVLDGVVCARLTHHLKRSEQGQLIAELARVASRFVVVSFSELNSLPNIVRRARGKAVSRGSVALAEIRRMAGEAGGQVTRVGTVTQLGSRHRFVLIRLT